MLRKAILVLAMTSCWALPSKIIRPCTTIACVASQLAQLSRCNPEVPGFIPSSYMIDRFGYNAPYCNATFIDNDLVIRNHDKCFVSEYYYNVETYNLVMGLDCPELGFESTRTVVQHYSLQEDLVYDYKYQGIYALIRLTLTMPLTEPLGLDLCSSYTFADVTALPDKPNKKSNQSETANCVSIDDASMNICERETFAYRANQLARYYINSVLCDFGCHF